MLGAGTIREFQRDAAKRAAQENCTPFVVWPEDLATFPPFPFPSIGDYVPEGWKEINRYFVDSSGFGQDGEPALSVPQFIARIKVGHAYAIVEEGQFQLYVGEFIRSNTDA